MTTIVVFALALALLPVPSSSDVNSLPGNQAQPSAAVGPDGVLYVVYQDDRNGDADIYLARSLDGGNSFNDPSEHILVYDDGSSTASQGYPAIDVDSSGTIHVVFVAGYANILYYTYSIDGGLSFNNILKISDAPTGTQNVAQYPRICVDDIADRIYVGWRDSRNNATKAYYCLGNIADQGISFSENRIISGDSTSSVSQSAPAIVVDDSGTLYVAWHDNRAGDLNIYYKISTDFGETFGSESRLDDGSVGDQAKASLAVDSMGTLYASYSADDSPDSLLDSTIASIVIASRSYEGSFTGYQTIASGGCLDPVISVLDGGLLFLMYNEVIVLGQETYRAMFYTHSLDGGSTWRNPKQVDEHSAAIQNYRQSVVPFDSGGICLIWEANSETDSNVVSDLETESLPDRMDVSISPIKAKPIPEQVIGFDVHVIANSQPLSGCTVQFFSDSGGFFSPITDHGNGSYSIEYTAPYLPLGSKISICAQVAKAGYPDDGAMSRAIVSENENPVAVIMGDESGEVGQELDFYGSGSYDLDGTIVSYDWDFNDGSSASGMNVTHAFSEVGIFSVALTVTDDGGLNGSTILDVSIEEIILPLSIQLSMNKTYLETGGTASVIVYVISNGTMVENALVDAYCKGEKLNKPVTVVPDMTFTDGNGEAYLTLVADPINHSYPEILYVSASKNGYQTTSVSLSFSVLVEPIAIFTSSVNGLQVTFNASESQDPDGFIELYEWNFGDGNSGDGMLTVHDYADPGTYSVTLEVTDDERAFDTEVQSVIIDPAYLQAEILPAEEPIESGVTTEIAVQVTFDGAPVEDVSVVLECSYRSTITPPSALTDVNGMAYFDFHARCYYDITMTLIASCSKDGYQDGFASKDMILNYPDLYVSYILESPTVLAGDNMNVQVIVTDLVGAPIIGASILTFPQMGYMEPPGTETDFGGISNFTYFAPIIGNQSEEATIGLVVSKYGYDVNDYVDIIIMIEPRPVLTVTAQLNSDRILWYENVFINVTVESFGVPLENIEVTTTVLFGKGSLWESPLFTNESGMAPFRYIHGIVLDQELVIIRFSANESGYIDGEEVIFFYIYAPYVEIQILECPEAVAPEERFEVTVRLIDDKSQPIAGLTIFFIFESNISYDTLVRRTNSEGVAVRVYSSPYTEYPIILNLTMIFSTKGHHESWNWTEILVDPSLSGDSEASSSSIDFIEDSIESVSRGVAILNFVAIALIFILGIAPFCHAHRIAFMRRVEKAE